MPNVRNLCPYDISIEACDVSMEWPAYDGLPPQLVFERGELNGAYAPRVVGVEGLPDVDPDWINIVPEDVALVAARDYGRKDLVYVTSPRCREMIRP